jgi:hypothetical protein
MYVAEPEKALEYGGWPKVVLALDRRKLLPTWRKVPYETPSEEQAIIQAEYPTRLVSEDGRSIWFSRLAESDLRVASGYEVAYARFCPASKGSPLLALFVMSDDADAQTAFLP